MSKKDELLSIGEMAKFTGVGIQALRYYERKNILKPAYIDPNTGYRYYSLEQANSIDVISACVELNIPLKELVNLFDTEDLTQLQEFFARNKKAAAKKLEIINTMFILADKALARMESNKPYKLEQIYKKEIFEKHYYVKACEQTLENANRAKMLINFAEEAKENLAKHYDTSTIDESMVLVEHGFLCKHSSTGSQYFNFAEIPKSVVNEKSISVASGSYYFRKSKKSEIENAPDIFKQQLEGISDFMIVEVEEMISGKAKINEPVYDLRLVI